MKKSHSRALFCVIIVNIIIISCKILEPEIIKLTKKLRSVPETFIRQVTHDHSTAQSGTFVHSDRRQAVIEGLIQQYSVDYNYTLNDSPWVLAARWLTSRTVHPSNVTQHLGGVLRALERSAIKRADVGHRGTQLKLSLILEGGQRVAFKPQWYERDRVIVGQPYSGADRHNAEVVAFHLNRLLELNRAPLVVGRRIDLRKEVMPVAEPQLLETFFMSGQNTCFYGRCYYCQGEKYGVCGKGSILEGAIVLWLPQSAHLNLHRSPWARTYRRDKLPRWMEDSTYCDDIKTHLTATTLLDIVDTSVFDHIIGNADRHHYETFVDKPDSVLLLLDNAKSFGNPHHDEHTILAPLYQCCRIRMSLWKRLLLLQEGILSEVMKAILENEPIAPLLTDPHFDAMDRRLMQIMDEVDRCFLKHSVADVLVDV